jgi:hypothetical protein
MAAATQMKAATLKTSVPDEVNIAWFMYSWNLSIDISYRMELAM